MIRLLLFLLLCLTLNSFGQTLNQDSIDSVRFYEETILIKKKLDSIYSPFKNEYNSFRSYCSNGEISVHIPIAGYILENVFFDKNDTIYSSSPLPLKLKKGNKTVLFLHLEPEYLGNYCDSTNIVIMTEIELPVERNKNKVSENTQFSFYTGIWFFPFKQTPTGTVAIEKIDYRVYAVELNVRFDFDGSNERYRIFETDFLIRLL